MALSSRKGRKIDTAFVDVLEGRSATERGIRKIVSKSRSKIQSHKVDKTRGFKFKRQKYGQGTLTTQTMISGEDKGKKLVNYQQRGVGGYTYEQEPGSKERENLKILGTKKEATVKTEASAPVYIGGQQVSDENVAKIMQRNPDLAKANVPEPESKSMAEEMGFGFSEEEKQPSQPSVKEAFTSEPVVTAQSVRNPHKIRVIQPKPMRQQMGPVRNIKGVGKTRRINTGNIV